MTYNYATNTWTSIMNDPFFIGFDKFSQRISSTLNTQHQNFPPYNVRKIDEDTFVVELAVAGFAKEDLAITEHDGILTVEGTKEDSPEDYIHKGIAGRKFTRTFTLGEYIFVSTADLNDGMLYVVLKREVPEDKKPKIIDIK